MAKREIEFGYIGDLTVTTKWVDYTSIEELQEKIKSFKKAFLELVNGMNPEYKGLRVRYYILDEDDFGEATPDKVCKWGVEIDPLKDEAIEEIITWA